MKNKADFWSGIGLIIFAVAVIAGLLPWAFWYQSQTVESFTVTTKIIYMETNNDETYILSDTRKSLILLADGVIVTPGRYYELTIGERTNAERPTIISALEIK